MNIRIEAEDSVVTQRLKSTGRVSPALRRLITQQFNLCCNCGAECDLDRPIFAGYDIAQGPVFVGACCSHLLRELATPVYNLDSPNLSVEDEVTIWRYMDFPKFAAMLKDKGIYFAAANTMEDKFEGASGLADREQNWDEFYLNFFRGAILTAPRNEASSLPTPHEVEVQAAELLKQIKGSTSRARQQQISCWHMSEHESEAFWRIYCPPNSSGLAIKSSCGRLWDALAATEGAIVGRVHYLDFRKKYSSTQWYRIFQKRDSLKHENELRAVIRPDSRSASKGTLVECELEELVVEIVLSPFSPAWFEGVVLATIAAFGQDIPVRRSELLNEPFY